ncbi:MAG: chemotaxis protein CheC [Anaerolineae bacterium]|nr:chemotaxis protein CheC [Anaerolineae bacterium]
MKPTPDQIDTLKELINIGVGRAAGMLNSMLQSQVLLEVPYVKIFSLLTLKEEMGKLGSQKLSTVRLSFKGPFSGVASLVFPPDSAGKFVDVLTGEEPATPDLDSIRIGTLTEVGNIILNGVMGSIGNVLDRRINYSVPTYIEDNIERLLLADGLDADTTILLAHTHFTIEQLCIEGDIILLFEVGSFDALLSAIDAINLNVS